MAGGHPRETIEASFDIIHEGTGKVHLIEAETIHVASQVMALLPARVTGPNETKSSMWYIRLNHTRLADSILELCGITPSTGGGLRRVCLHILTRFTSPAPHTLPPRSGAATILGAKQKGRDRAHQLDKLDSILKDAVANHGMSSFSSKRLTVLVESCLPLPSNVVEAIDTLQRAIAKVKSLDDSKAEPRRTKRFEDAAKSLRSIRDLISVLDNLNLGPLPGPETQHIEILTCRPLYISLDLGLSQRRRHFHGGTIFQCIALPDDFFQKFDPNEHNDALISPTGRGIKIAEGGNYSDLVRRNRPPGNFASSIVNQYTTARIPVCAGVRFSIGKIVELVYLASTLSGRTNMSDGVSDFLQKSGTDKQSMEALRLSLGHPLHFAAFMRVIVASVHGMDEASTPDRFLVASRLWNAGICAEYLPQSGVVLSLVNRLHGEAAETTGSSDWSLLELQGACALLRIPFIVIVQPHLLKDKASVRLRQVTFDTLPQGPSSTGGCSEIFVSLDNLASTILGASPRRGSEDALEDIIIDSSGPPTISRELRGSRSARVECIFVDNDQYISSTREISKSETPHYKSTLKVMKSVKQSAESYLSSLQDPASHAEFGLEGTPVFAVTELTFFVLRDFGSALMRRERKDMSAAGACAEMIERYPKHKRALKTLSVAIDNFMIQRYNFWSGSGGSDLPSNSGDQPSSSSSSLITVLLYSKIDDRFDLITLNSNKGKGRGSGHLASTKRR